MKKIILCAAMIIASANVFGQVAATCNATTKKGTPCSRKAVVNGYCKQHNPAAVRCAGKTKAGQPCQLLAGKDSRFCHLHKNQ